MKFISALCATLLLIFGYAPGAWAEQDDRLMLDKLAVDEWIKGEPVDLAKGKGKQAYVVEFWATWCPPCLETIPHLTELQAKYKDKAIFIGVSTEKADKVKPFVTEQGEKMNYTVALDYNGGVSEALMSTMGVQGIPHAFIVDKNGEVVWHGSPQSPGMTKALDAVLDGTHDPAPFRAEYKVSKVKMQIIQKVMPLMQTYGELVVTGTADEGKKAEAIGQKILDEGSQVPEILASLVQFVLTNPDIQHRDKALALRAAEKLYKSKSAEDPQPNLAYIHALHANGKGAEAEKIQAETIASFPEKHPARTQLPALFERIKEHADSLNKAPEPQQKPKADEAVAE